MKRNFPDKHLVQFIESIQPKGVAVDLGCGSGADAMYLASAGFDKEMDICFIQLESSKIHKIIA